MKFNLPKVWDASCRQLRTQKEELCLSRGNPLTLSDTSVLFFPGESIDSIPLFRSSWFNPTFAVASKALDSLCLCLRPLQSFFSLNEPCAQLIRVFDSHEQGFSWTGRLVCFRSLLIIELLPQFLSPMKTKDGDFLSSSFNCEEAIKFSEPACWPRWIGSSISSKHF